MWDELDPRSLDSRDREQSDPRDAESMDPRDVFTRGLDLPHGLERERVHVHGHDYQLRGSEVRTLATIGAFRVVPVSDLTTNADGRRTCGTGPRPAPCGGADPRRGTSGSRERTPIVTLTDRGRELLESHRTREHEPAQAFHAGLLRSRELTHDAQCRAYLRRERLSCGVRIHRVVLDYELKREYQRFLQERNRDRSDSDGRPDRTREEIQDWAHEHDLPADEDGVQFPDVRIEYEWPDGRRDVEDVEVTTPHYRGAHAAAKARAGFPRYRAGGGRVGGRTGRGGGRPSDVRLAGELPERPGERRRAVNSWASRASSRLSCDRHALCGRVSRTVLHVRARLWPEDARLLPNLLSRGYAIREYAVITERAYHVHYKPLYRAIGEPNNRHRRPTTLARAIERLMLLDAVRDSDRTWLATERTSSDTLH